MITTLIWDYIDNPIHRNHHSIIHNNLSGMVSVGFVDYLATTQSKERTVWRVTGSDTEEIGMGIRALAESLGVALTMETLK